MFTHVFARNWKYAIFSFRTHKIRRKGTAFFANSLFDPGKIFPRPWLAAYQIIQQAEENLTGSGQICEQSQEILLSTAWTSQGLKNLTWSLCSWGILPYLFKELFTSRV
jgi:hypothetical protein